MDKEALITALKALGIEAGDLLLVHSDLRPFRLPQMPPQEILRFYYDALKEVLGPTGTVAVPAYFYEYARYGEPFDTDLSPVSKPLGVFSAYINALPGRIRSANPLQSLAAIGPHAENLCGGDSLMGYGTNSPWHRLCSLQGKMLFLGVALQPMTFVHHIEQQYGVPHLYQKLYQMPVTRSGKPIPGNPVSSVRYLDYEIVYQLKFFQEELKKRGQLHGTEVERAPLFLVSAQEAFKTGLELLAQNPYCFLQKPPKFVPGKIPTDGYTYG